MPRMSACVTVTQLHSRQHIDDKSVDGKRTRPNVSCLCVLPFGWVWETVLIIWFGAVQEPSRS